MDRASWLEYSVEFTQIPRHSWPAIRVSCRVTCSFGSRHRGLPQTQLGQILYCNKARVNDPLLARRVRRPTDAFGSPRPWAVFGLSDQCDLNVRNNSEASSAYRSTQ